MPDLTKLTNRELQNLIDNHRRKNATDKPLYADAMTEYHRRHGGELSLECTIAYIRKAASEMRFVSYGELAEANGATWDKVRYPMNDHLWVLVDYARRRGWPMLSAMIVNKQHVQTGQMEDATLTGFVEAARALGYVITDQKAFLREQQSLCFQWGLSQV